MKTFTYNLFKSFTLVFSPTMGYPYIACISLHLLTCVPRTLSHWYILSFSSAFN